MNQAWVATDKVFRLMDALRAAHEGKLLTDDFYAETRAHLVGAMRQALHDSIDASLAELLER